MDLKQQLIDFGCSNEFVDIALGYQQFYQPNSDIETFIEYVEEEHAKVEEAEAIQEMDKQIINATDILEEFTDEDEV
jgi:hypothetical protein